MVCTLQEHPTKVHQPVSSAKWHVFPRLPTACTFSLCKVLNSDLSAAMTTGLCFGRVQLIISITDSSTQTVQLVDVFCYQSVNVRAKKHLHSLLFTLIVIFDYVAF